MTASLALLLSVMVLTVVIASSRTFAETFTAIDVPNASLTQAFQATQRQNEASDACKPRVDIEALSRLNTIGLNPP
jgi:hypothetical protein